MQLKKLQTKTSASLLYGNLSCNGRHLAYVHHAEVVVVPDSAVASASPSPTVVRLPIKDEVLVKQARFVELGGTDYLVVAGQRALQIFTGDGKKCLHMQPVLTPGTAESPSFFRGVAGVTAGGGDFLCAGSSSGEIALLACHSGSFGHPVLLKEPGTPIVDVDASPYPENPDDCLVASADSSGQLLLLMVGPGGSCGAYASFGGDPNALCTALRIRKQWLLSAYCTGHVRIHDVLSKVVMVQIAAHARWINALDVHPTKDVMATAAEDCTVSVWQLPEVPGAQLKHLSSVVVPDSLLCGVGFAGGAARSHVACSAYDVDAVHTFQFE